MTKRILRFMVLAIGLLTTVPTLAQMAPDASSDLGSQTLFGDKLTLKAGYKMWIAKWQAPLAGGNAIQQITSDHPTVMSGPMITGRLKLREGAWFNSAFASFYWLNGGFDFQENRTISGTSVTNGSSNALRRDYAITAGVTIWEGFGVFAGYYDNRQRFLTTNTSVTPVAGVQTRFTNTRSLKGPILGVFGGMPLTERVSAYGNLAYAILDFNSENQSVAAPFNRLATKAVHGWATEVGVNIAGPRAWKIGTELQLGFRFQEIQKTFGGTNPTLQNPGYESIANDITYGPTISINAMF